MHIGFSHRYPKLHGQTSARLISIELCERNELSPDFIIYDTSYDGGLYPLSPGRYMVLVFLGNKLIPFTTVRPWTKSKYLYYKGGIGSEFEIRYKDGA